MGNAWPKLHNAMWPGIVGKGEEGNPAIDLETMLDLTAAAEIDGQKFDGVDLFLAEPHISIDATDEQIEALAEMVRSRGLVVGSVVAPVWPPVGGGPAMGTPEERDRFVEMVSKAARIASRLRELGVRPYGVVRIDSASGVDAWAEDPTANTEAIAETFRRASEAAAAYGERLAAEGEICWGGMHSWKDMVDLLETVDQPGQVGFQADMSHTLLYTLGANAPEHRVAPADFDWDRAELDAAYRTVANALRPWTIDFHVAQNDGTVFGSGSHDKTGRHCTVHDPNGRLDIVAHAGFWMNDENGEPTRAFQHICWDGCMFPNSTMLDQQTWNDVLGAMIQVREAHGWND